MRYEVAKEYFCVPVDIDELKRDFDMLCATSCQFKDDPKCKTCEINHKSFSEYLQERIGK